MGYLKTLQSWKKKSIKDLLPPPLKAAHAEYSMILSAADAPPNFTSELFNISLKAIQSALTVDLSHLSERGPQAEKFANLFPGEHYRLLAGFIKELKPKLVVDIGTSTGLSVLAMKSLLPETSRIATFDITNWKSYPDTLFRESDFDSQLTQYVDDLGDAATFKRYESLLSEAELILLDVTHDGDLEERILFSLSQTPFKTRAYVLLDDIKVWTMLKTWREISSPKLDLTSFGHWSGTGIIEISSASRKK